MAYNVEDKSSFVVKEEVLKELGEVVGAYMEEYVGRKFKSLEILGTVAE